MTEPFIGQIQPLAFAFAPRNWAQCNGQILSIQQNTALFSLLGTQFGGNGTTTFGLPNLQSRAPIHAGNSFFQGEEGGQEQVTITLNTMPAHNHAFVGASTDGNSANPADNFALAKAFKPSGNADSFYGVDSSPQPLNAASVSPVGGNGPHTNIQPYQVINWCIAMSGIFPSRG
jgi:microcystin-dependent protein